MRLKAFIHLGIVSIFLTGCGVSNGIGLGKQEVKSYFKKGEVISSKKVIVDSTKVALLKGVGAGTLAGGTVGAFSGNVVQGAIIGGTVGAFSGIGVGYAKNGNEEEAYEITIREGLKEYIAYTKQELEYKQELEFIVRPDGTITNIAIIKNFNEEE